MDIGLTERVVLVTGAAGGIGHEVVRAFRREGARVIVHFHTNRDRARALAGEPGPECVALGGDLTQEARVAVAPFGTAEASFNMAFAQPGTLTGRATLAPDDLIEDNVRHVKVVVNKALQALLITDSDVADQRSAAFFISRALAPSAEAAPGLALIRRHSQDADRGVLETADVFLLVAPAALSGESVEIIERRVQDGARFAAFLDGPTAPLLVPPTFAPPLRRK